MHNKNQQVYNYLGDVYFFDQDISQQVKVFLIKWVSLNIQGELQIRVASFFLVLHTKTEK
jgi:hypothetical protein